MRTPSKETRGVKRKKNPVSEEREVAQASFVEEGLTMSMAVESEDNEFFEDRDGRGGGPLVTSEEEEELDYNDNVDVEDDDKGEDDEITFQYGVNNNATRGEASVTIGHSSAGHHVDGGIEKRDGSGVKRSSCGAAG